MDWKTVPENNNYSVSDEGLVRNSRGEFVRQHITWHGYQRVYLSRNGKTTGRTVHSLVLSAFVGPRPAGMQACHMDGNKQNNHISNLMWGSRVENERHKIAHGTAPRRAKNGRAKLSEAAIKEIRAVYVKQTPSRRGNETLRQLVRKYSVHRNTILRAAKGEQWK